jgi:lipopolysaccharide/colanic/teichoic acid biosynthesis glycosyltransferase
VQRDQPAVRRSVCGGQIGQMIRRLTDIAVALVALTVLSPFFVLTSLAILLESPGSPFYGGWRAGKNGVRFRMWKFRTMVRGADKLGFITAPRDLRITRVGRFLRLTKIDELPQFFNLLVGELTLVGPRAEDLTVVGRYTPEQTETLKVKPGITGPGTLYYTTDQADTIPGDNPEQFYLDHLLDEKLRIDLEYLKRRTLSSDCRVVLRTMMLVAKALGSAVRASGA